jgi:alkanesulfonate monooxygenase SsuD/methylene tetrahydromethanopterin reductase-like flavin-dependent oxidoreductase (luciferase family)
MSTELGLLVPLTDDVYDTAEEDRLHRCVADGLVQGIWVRDLPALPVGDEDAGQGHDPFAYIGRLAARIPGTTFGTAVAIGGVRHPLVLARAALSAQVYAGNRFVLGIGTGGKRPMSEALGVFGRDPVVFADEWVRTRQALHGTVPDGLHFPAPAGFRPPPMWLATANPVYWDLLAGRIDGWFTGFLLPKPFEETLGKLVAINGPTQCGVRLAIDIRPAADAPAKPFVDKGFMVCSAAQLRAVFRGYRDFPIDHLVLSVRHDADLAQIRLARDCWEASR